MKTTVLRSFSSIFDTEVYVVLIPSNNQLLPQRGSLTEGSEDAECTSQPVSLDRMVLFMRYSSMSQHVLTLKEEM